MYDSSPDSMTPTFVIATGTISNPVYFTRDGKFSPHIERARRFFLQTAAESCARGMRCPWRIEQKTWGDLP